MKIGLSTCGSKPIDDSLFLGCAEAGIGCVEITLNHGLYDGFDYEAAMKLAEKYSVEIWSCHLPFSPFATNDISSTDEEKRQNSIALQKSIIQRAGDAGIRRFIIHPSGERIEFPERRSRLLCSKDSLSVLADEAEKFGAIICAEDLPRTCIGRSSYDLCELTKDDDRLKICFDTNHLLGEYIPDFIRKVGRKIVTTHISDYDFIDEKHWLPGEGLIDWNELYSGLLEVGYDGPWLYEVSFTDSPKCFTRERAISFGDIARNANEIFEGKPLTVLANTPRED